MLFTLFYDMLLLFGALLYLPKFLYDRFVIGKYSESFRARLGKGLKGIERDGERSIWVHAVSVGEVKAVAKLVRELKESGGAHRVVVSTITETGMAEAKRSIPSADHFVYLPFDLSWIIKPIVKRVSPELVILSETDFWYNFLSAAKGCGAKVALVNGKLSAQSMRRFSLFPYFSRKIFDLFDLFLLQSDHHLERFERAGARREKMAVTGNMKLDDESAPLSKEELALFKRELGIEERERVVVLGSTHSPEESLFLEEFQVKWRAYPDIVLIIVPRHPERFDEVASLIAQKAIPFARYSRLSERRGGERVLLMDAMGSLRKCYQAADIAIVCGSFTGRVGGHNIIEPCQYGVATLFGPHMESQPELLRLVEMYSAALQVGKESVGDVVIDLLECDEEKRRLGEAGRRLFLSSRGATKMSVELLEKLFKARKALNF